MSPKRVPKFVSYLRVSTARQGASGLGLEAQRAAVESYLHSVGNGAPLAEFVEVESGKRDDNRPQLQAALAACKLRHAVLIVAKLDRLSRNVVFISTLMESGVDFVACDFPQANKLTVHILAAVAEHEREAISQRTKAALAAAKARGQKLGGYREHAPDIALYQPQAVAALMQNADAAAQGLADAIGEARAAGAKTLREIARHLNDAGIETRRGKAWTACAVARVLARLTE